MVAGAAAHDVVGSDAALAIRRTGQRDQTPRTRDDVAHLHDIAHGVDRGIARLHALIHANAAALADLQPGGLCQRTLRLHAHAENHDIRRQSSSIFEHHDGGAGRFGIARRFKRGHRAAGAKFHAMLLQFQMQPRGHFGIERSHDLRQSLDERHGHTAMTHELLRHFQTDVTSAHDQCSRALALAEPRFDPHHIGHVAHSEVTLALNAGNRRCQRCRAGGNDQRIVRQRVFAVVRQLAHVHDLGLAINRHDLAVHPHVEIEARVQALRRLHQQVFLVHDLATHKVRQAAVRKGDMRSALQHNDFSFFRETTRTRCRTGTTCDASDDDQTIGIHDFMGFIQT